MELMGKWKIKKVFCITPDGIAYMLLPPEDFAQMDTGKEVRLLDGMAIVEEHPWKEENGAYFYHTGMEGDAGGVPVDPYEKLEPDEDGCLSMSAGLLRIEKYEHVIGERACFGKLLSERRSPETAVFRKG